MNPAGWSVMILSIGAVVVMLGYCLYRVLTLPSVEAEEDALDPSGTAAGTCESVVCKSCGRSSRAGATFCGCCGERLH